MNHAVVRLLRGGGLLLAAALIVPQADAQSSTPPVSVVIKAMRFTPATVTVKAGSPVAWINQDDRDHQIRATDGSFESPNLSANGRFQHVMRKPGRVEYGCKYHPRERGTVVVEE